jgi:hypothetical protein
MTPTALLEHANVLARSILEAPLPASRFTRSYFVMNPGAGFEESFQVEHDRAFRELLVPQMAARARGRESQK